MPDFFIILLKINLVLVLFAAAYYLILRRLTFYVLNRVFLVFGILFSTLYPFIDLTEFFHQQNQQLVAFVPEFNQKVATMVPVNWITDYWFWISLMFYVGVVVMALRLIVQFVSLYKMHKKSSPGSVADFEVRILDEPVSPFSFWQTVYINPTLHKEKELKTILTHEQIHVKQWHSLDIILAELSVVFYWFNPGVWLMKRAVKENLEYITDERILKQGIDRKAYQYSLLDVGNLMPAVEIVNNFNLSDLKKRIKMMNVKRSSKFTLSRYLLVLPVLLVTTLAFTVSKKDIKKHLTPIKEALMSANIIDSVKVEAIVQPAQKLAIKKPIKKEVVLTEPDTARKLNFVFHSININSDSTKSAIAKLAMEKLLSLRSNGNINFKYGTQKIVKGIKITKVDSVPQMTHQFVEDLKISFEKDDIPAEILNKKTTSTIVLRGAKIVGKPTTSIDFKGADVYFNGNKISASEMSKIDPDQIESVSVKKANTVGEIFIIGHPQKDKP
jgi:hypothetical protein